MTTISPREVLNELSQLSSDEIADRFELLGITGVPCNPCDCPITNYFESIYGHFTTTTFPDKLRVREDWEYEYLPLDDNSSVRQFIIKFDNMYYDGLVRERIRAVKDNSVSKQER